MPQLPRRCWLDRAVDGGLAFAVAYIGVVSVRPSITSHVLAIAPGAKSR